MHDEDNVVDLKLEVLKGIRADLDSMRGELRDGLVDVRTELSDVRAELRDSLASVRAEMRHGFTEINARVERLENETIQGFSGVRREIDRTNARIDQNNARLDNLIKVSSSVARDHEVRISALEERRQPGRRTRRPPT